MLNAPPPNLAATGLLLVGDAVIVRTINSRVVAPLALCFSERVKLLYIPSTGSCVGSICWRRGSRDIRFGTRYPTIWQRRVAWLYMIRVAVALTVILCLPCAP